MREKEGWALNVTGTAQQRQEGVSKLHVLEKLLILGFIYDKEGISNKWGKNVFSESVVGCLTLIWDFRTCSLLSKCSVVLKQLTMLLKTEVSNSYYHLQISFNFGTHVCTYITVYTNRHVHTYVCIYQFSRKCKLG